MTVVSGISSFVVNGQNFDVNQDITFNPSFDKQENIPNWSRRNLLKLTPIVGKCMAKIIWDGTYDPGEVFSGLNGATVQVVTVTGQQFMLSDAYVTEVGDVSLQESTFEINFESYTTSSFSNTSGNF